MSINTIFNAYGREGVSIARSLGKKDLLFTAVGLKNDENTAFFSKYTKSKKEISDPSKNPEKFVSQLAGVLESNESFLFPLSDKCDIAIINFYDLLKGKTKFGYSLASRETTINKLKTLEIAKKSGLNVPITFSLSEMKNFSSIKKVLGAPFVIKPIQNYIYIGSDDTIKSLGSTRLISNQCDFNNFVSKNEKYAEHFLVEEFIPGNGYGFSALVNDCDKCVALFMHKRLHETEGFGGVSSFAKSIYDSYLKQISLRLLSKIKFKGVAMVEFRKNARTGKYVFMEINSRYWGTLPLAIASGIDFPYLHVSEWYNKNPDCREKYDRNMLWRFLVFGELKWLKSTLGLRNVQIPNYKNYSIGKTFSEFFGLFFKNNISYSVESISDPMPMLYTYYSYLKTLLKKV